MTLRVKVTAGFIAVCLIWGTTWAAVQIGIQTVPPLFSAALRFCVACVVLGGWMAYKKTPIPTDKKSWILITMIAATSYTVPFAFQYWGQKQIPSGLTSILFATFPFWVVILSKIFLKDERINRFQWIALLIGFFGVTLIFHEGLSQKNANFLLGMTAVLVSALIQSSALIILRKYRAHIDPIIMNFWAMLIGAIVLLGASVSMETISLNMFDRNSVIVLLYLGTLGTVFTFVTYFWLAQHVRAMTLSLISFITPVIALIIGVLWMNEYMGMEEGCGVLAVLGSLVFATTDDIRKFITKVKE